MAIGGNRIYHVNSNCSVLERAAQFYEALGLRRVIRTVPSRPQPGGAFGLDAVAWDAWVLQSEDGLEGLSIDLLEWKTPPPTGTPPPTVAQPGLVMTEKSTAWPRTSRFRCRSGAQTVVMKTTITSTTITQTRTTAR